MLATWFIQFNFLYDFLNFQTFVVNTSDYMFDWSENYCNQHGGHLASVHSDEEYFFIYSSLFNNIPKYRCMGEGSRSRHIGA